MPHNPQKTLSLFQQIGFGSVIIRVANGCVSSTPEPKVRYTRKPRSHLHRSEREPHARHPPGIKDAMRDFLHDIEGLTGVWDVTVKVANGVPVQWDFEEVRPLQSTLKN